MAVRVDAKKLAIVGSPVRVIEGVRLAGQAQFTTARDGTLVFAAGYGERNLSMVWLDRTGDATPALEARAAFQSPRLSPDRRTRRHVDWFGLRNRSRAYEFERGTRLRLTTSGVNRRGIWYPDGARIAFYSAPVTGGEQDLFALSASGGSPAQFATIGPPSTSSRWC